MPVASRLVQTPSSSRSPGIGGMNGSAPLASTTCSAVWCSPPTSTTPVPASRPLPRSRSMPVAGQPVLLARVGVVGDHEVAPRERGLDVDLGSCLRVARAVDRLARPQQRLGRDARVVGALAADELALDDRDAQAALRQRPGAVLPGGAAADHDHVVVVAHGPSPGRLEGGLHGRGLRVRVGQRVVQADARADPELGEHLLRCHSTVRGLRNSWAPISGFVSPSRASRAMCSSCGVSSSRVSARRLRTVSPVAWSSWRARSANPSTPISANSSCAARSCSRASTRRPLAAQPLAVEQVRAGELAAHRACGRAARSPPGRARSAASPSLSSARDRASIPSAQSVPARPRRRRALRDASPASSAVRSAPPPRSARAAPS